MRGSTAITIQKQFWLRASVSGSFWGVTYDRPKVCAPGAVTKGQALKVVVQYIDQRPARMHEDFMKLAVEALQAAWPCKK